MGKHVISDLWQMQSLPLEVKIRMTKYRIRQWVEYYGEEGVYVSFSGGKDSTVLLDLVRQMYPNVTAVFVDTGLEYPEIREFVKTFSNVVWLKPKKNFKQVITEFGYPFISKEVSGKIYEARNKPDGYAATQCFSPDSEKVQKYGHRYDYSKWKFFFEAPFKVGANCCNVMKKNPVKKYERDSHRVGITAQMASESAVRTRQWLENGCNGFNKKRPISNPMSFWTEQDVLLYIKLHDLQICSVYGNIVTEPSDSNYKFAENSEIFDKDRPLLKTTGCSRTGCMFCGYGCHLEKSPTRFEQMKETHPKQYAYIMKPVGEGGLGYKDVIDWINQHGNMNIKY